jgi:hypothetical protein
VLGSWERHQAVCQAPQRGNALNMGNGDQHCTFLMLKANDASAAEAVTPEDRDAASKLTRINHLNLPSPLWMRLKDQRFHHVSQFATASDLILNKSNCCTSKLRLPECSLIHMCS